LRKSGKYTGFFHLYLKLYYKIVSPHIFNLFSDIFFHLEHPVELFTLQDTDQSPSTQLLVETCSRVTHLIECK